MKLEVNNAPDFKINGQWVKSKTINGVRHHTRSYIVWCGVMERVKVGGKFQTNHPSYLGVTTSFDGFQHFADWCQEQVGYLNKSDTTAGRFWSLDKDVIKMHNKVYGPEYCAFVPQQINNVLIFRQAQPSRRVKDNLPIGVSFHKVTSMYQAEVSTNKGKSTYLGLFENPLDGHKAWQEAKVGQIDNCITTYDGIVCDRVLEGLSKHRDAIIYDINTGRETSRF